jgi:hypothetical protein
VIRELWSESQSPISIKTIICLVWSSSAIYVSCFSIPIKPMPDTSIFAAAAYRGRGKHLHNYICFTVLTSSSLINLHGWVSLEEAESSIKLKCKSQEKCLAFQSLAFGKT